MPPSLRAMRTIKLRSRLIAAALICIVWFGALPNVYGADPVSRAVNSYDQLGAKIRDRIDGLDWSGGKVRAYVSDLGDRVTILDLDADLSSPPGEAQKLFLSAAALRTLSRDFRFTTELALRGDVEKKTLTGALIVRGTGDPTLGLDEADKLFERWVNIIRDRKIRVIQGPLVLDALAFDNQTFAPGWQLDLMGSPALPEISALNLNGNCVEIHWRSDRKVGAVARYRTRPDLEEFFFVSNNVRIVGRDVVGTRSWFRTQGTELLNAAGELTARTEPIDQVGVGVPAVYFGETFKAALGDRRVKVEGEVRILDGVNAAKATADTVELLHVHHSADLASIIARMIRENRTLDAEAILKTLGSRRSGRAGSFADGAEAVTAFLRDNGLPASGMVVIDGSGMSSLNRATPLQIMSVIRHLEGSLGADEFESWFRTEMPREATGQGPIEGSEFPVPRLAGLRVLMSPMDSGYSAVGWVRNRFGRRLHFVFLVSGSRVPPSVLGTQVGGLIEAIAESGIR